MRKPLFLPAALLLGLALGACGDRDRIEGQWTTSDFRMEKPCTDQLDFEAGQIVTTLSCLLTEGSYGQQVMVGHYVRQESQVLVYPTASSCPKQSKDTMVWRVDINRDQMDRTIGIETARYQRGGANVAGIRVTGCFDDKLKEFDEGPVVQLP